MKVLVALKTCDFPKYAARRKLIENSWAKRLPKGFEFRSFTGAILGVPDDYDHLCEKTRAICRAAQGYDKLLIVDDDVFVRTERLRVPDADYAGHVLDGRYCSGSFYWLSGIAAAILATSPVGPGDTSAEDQWAARNLWLHGVTPRHMPEVALEPCLCGNCIPEIPPEDWVAYTMWIKFKEELYLSWESDAARNGDAG